MSDRPESLEELIQHERWKQAALAKATAPLPKSPPAAESPGEALVRRWAEADKAEREDEQLVRRVEREHPAAPTREARDDPLRAVAKQRQAHHRRIKRRVFGR